MTKMCGLPERLETKAIFCPSGLQEGEVSIPQALVSRLGFCHRVHQVNIGVIVNGKCDRKPRAIGDKTPPVLRPGLLKFVGIFDSRIHDEKVRVIITVTGVINLGCIGRE